MVISENSEVTDQNSTGFLNLTLFRQSFYTCVCMYVLFIYVHTYVCMYTCMYACLCVYVYICVCPCTYVCMYVRTYIIVFMCMYICANTDVCICVRRYVKYVFMDVCVHVYVVECARVYIYICTSGSGAQIRGARLMWRLNFWRWYLMFVDQEYGKFFHPFGA